MEETTRIATRLLGHIRNELLETDESFGLDSDLFTAGLDSMSIMQILLFIEEEFAVRLPDGAVTRATFGTARHLAEATILAGTASANGLTGSAGRHGTPGWSAGRGRGDADADGRVR